MTDGSRGSTNDPTIILEMKPGRYFVGVWFAGNGTTADWMAALFRDEQPIQPFSTGEFRWEFRFRFKYYHPDYDKQAFDTKDDRSNFQVKGFVGTEAHVLGLCEKIAAIVFLELYQKTDFVLLMTSDAATIIERLKTRPWCHVRMTEKR